MVSALRCVSKYAIHQEMLMSTSSVRRRMRTRDEEARGMTREKGEAGEERGQCEHHLEEPKGQCEDAK